MLMGLRLGVGVFAILFLLIGLGFLFRPANLAAKFFLSANGNQGLATLRADMTAFFIGSALFALAGAWTGRPGWLLVPLALVGIAFVGRLLSLVLDGAARTAFPPMIAEAVIMALLAATYWTTLKG
jgi:hypothetical protein